jgi:hypothetical protein
MNCFRSTAVLAAFTGLVTLSAGTAARAQVLEQVPSDALVVFKVSNLKAVSDKVAKFGAALGLDAMVPQFADPLAALQEGMQINEGLDTAGELAFVFIKPAEGQEPDQSMIVLVPTSDYKAFLGNFKGAKTAGAITSFAPEGGGPEVNVANWGKYAAVGPNKALLGKKPAGLKLSGLAAKQAKERDAFLFVNMPVVKDMVLPMLTGARAEAMAGIEKEMGANPEAKEFTGVVRAAVGQVMNSAEGFLNDATAASISFHLSDDGLSTTLMAEFKPDSNLGGIAKQLKNTDQPLMAGLPTANRKYFAFGGMVNDPEVSAKLMGDFFDPIAKELAGTESGKGVAEAIEAAKRSMGATKTVAFGYPAPTGAIGADSIVQSVMVIQGDSKSLHDAQKQMLQSVADVMKRVPQQGGAFGYEHAPAGKTVGSLKLDTYSYTMTPDENNPQAAQAQQMMALVYGPNGMSGVFGAVDNDTYLVVQGGTDKLLAEAVKAAQDPKDTLSEDAGVKMVAAHLPKSRIGVEYIKLDNIITAGVKYAQGFNVPIKMQLPPNLPPIGASVASEGSAIRIDGFLPTQLVQSIVAAGMQTFMQMQGAEGGGGPDGL